MPRQRRDVVWAPRATKDLKDVWHYYARVASPEVADKLLREIDEAAARLAVEATVWRARDDLMPGLRAIRVPPYLIFYRVRDDLTQVVRVLHERRNLPEILAREKR
jgi:addiction module RelE/StbE family toxin